MTDEEALEILEHNWTGLSNPDYTEKELCEALDLAIKALDQISHLKDRPCEACEFYTGEGCSKWECVFEGSEAE